MAMRTRRVAVGMAFGVAVIAAAGLAHAAGGLRMTPTAGPAGATFTIDVDCATAPALARAHTQDGPEQGTIAAFVPEDITEIAPSTWQVSRTAGSTDEIWWAICDGADVGQARFDAEAPHLWFGPRPSAGFSPIVGRTTVEGTDCPPGSTAQVAITSGDEVLVLEAVAIDEFGDWTADLPVKVGDADLRIEASCGEVVYETLAAPSTSTPLTAAPTTPGTAPGSGGPPPAAAVPGDPGYTG